MTQKRKELYISLLIGAFLILVYIFQIKGYILSEKFFEAKYVSSASSIYNFADIFSPKLNGEPYFEIGPLYYFIQKLVSVFLGGFSELSVRITSALSFIGTVIGTYFLIRKIFNKQYALISALTVLTTIAFVIFSCVSTPYLISACLQVMAVLLGIFPLFKENDKHKKYYFSGFWLLYSLAVLTQGLSGLWLPIIVILFAYIVSGKTKELIKSENLKTGLLCFILLIGIWLFNSYRMNGIEYFHSMIAYVKPKIFINKGLEGYKIFFSYFSLFLVVGFLPWVFSLISMLFKNNSLKSFYNNKFSLEKMHAETGEKILIISVFAFYTGLFLYILQGINDFARLLPVFFFGALVVAYYWYGIIYQNSQKVNLSSLMFYISLIAVDFIVIGVYYFGSPVLKTYIEDLIVPLTLITLFVAMPGIITVVLKRDVLNYAMHIVLSILLFFVSTGLLYDYVNSFGAEDLKVFSLKAKEDKAILVTFDLQDRFAMSYYYGNPVIFNGIMSANEIYDKYGDSDGIYMVLKLTDLAYLDKFFIYEVVETGKHYCEITNIKYLPMDEVSENPNTEPEIE